MQIEDRWPQIPDYPQHADALDSKLVKKFVTAAHGDAEAVREMLQENPALLNACWDWGEGDFETALEAAGHMGNREIAEHLLSKGARMNLFCAAMLGNLDFVKAALAQDPNLLESKGPHGIPLVNHGEAGKENAAAVVEYLRSLE